VGFAHEAGADEGDVEVRHVWILPGAAGRG